MKNKDVLLELISLLRELPKRRFDYGVWCNKEAWKGHQDLSCGAPACAWGWCATLSDELTLVRQSESIEVVHDGDTGVGAAVRFFDIPEEMAKVMFIPTYDTHMFSEWVEAPGTAAPPSVVADHLERVLELYEEAVGC